MSSSIRCSYAFFVGLVLMNSVYCQESEREYKGGMNVKLDSSGKKYIHFSSWCTFWARAVDANPGTAINGIERKNWMDFSLRQFRLVTYSQITPAYLILADIGIDNQSFSSGGIPGGGNSGNGGATFNGTLGKKPVFYIHDLWNVNQLSLAL